MHAVLCLFIIWCACAAVEMIILCPSRAQQDCLRTAPQLVLHSNSSGNGGVLLACDMHALRSAACALSSEPFSVM